MSKCLTFTTFHEETFEYTFAKLTAGQSYDMIKPVMGKLNGSSDLEVASALSKFVYPKLVLVKLEGDEDFALKDKLWWSEVDQEFCNALIHPVIAYIIPGAKPHPLASSIE